MVGLGQNLKFQKTRKNRLYKHIKVVLCKKPLEETPNIPEMRPVCRFGSKIKIPKNMQKSIPQALLKQFCSKNG